MTVVRHTKQPDLQIDAIVEALKKTLVKSNCPEGYLRIENIYWDPSTNEVVIKVEEA